MSNTPSFAEEQYFKRVNEELVKKLADKRAKEEDVLNKEEITISSKFRARA